MRLETPKINIFAKSLNMAQDASLTALSVIPCSRFWVHINQLDESFQMGYDLNIPWLRWGTLPSLYRGSSHFEKCVFNSFCRSKE